MRVLLGALLSLVTFAASAQDWPTRPVTMIVPYAAGGPVDTVGRIMAQGLSEVLGQQVVVENVGGAGGMTGANRVAKAAPDGYTLLLGGSATLALVPALNGRKTLYDPLADFAHVVQFAEFGAHPDRAQGFSRKLAEGIRRLRQGEPRQDAVRQLGHRRGRAYLRAAARSDRWA